MILRFFAMAGLAAALFLLLAVAVGWDYYALAAEQRPAHSKHAVLRPSGSVGLTYGIAVAALFLLNLSYLLRKRLARLTWLGSLRSWMAFHILTGLSAGGLLLLHSALLPRSVLGVLAAAGLGVVILTGLIGRYIYAHVPRSVEGRELKGEELRRRLLEHRAQLEAFGVRAELLELRGSAVGSAHSLPARLFGLVAGDRSVRRAYVRMRRDLAGNAELGKILPLARRFCADQHWLARYGELRALMGSWRFLHRWLAVAIVLIVLFHVGIALRYGGLL